MATAEQREAEARQRRYRSRRAAEAAAEAYAWRYGEPHAVWQCVGGDGRYMIAYESERPHTQRDDVWHCVALVDPDGRIWY